MKLLIRLVLVLVLLAVIAGVIFVVMIDSIAKSGVEKGSAYALVVDTSVDEMDVGLLDGTVVMKGFRAGNPEGFDSPHLLKTGTFDLAVDTGSLFSDTIVVRRFRLDGLDVNIERKTLGSNIGKIVENLKRFQSDRPAEASEGKKVKVDKVVISNVTATFHLLQDLRGGEPIVVKVPTIELDDVSSDDPDGVVIGELISRLMPAILQAVLEQAEGKVPLPALGDLQGKVGSLAEMTGGVAERLTGSAATQAGDAAGQLLEGLMNNGADEGGSDRP